MSIREEERQVAANKSGRDPMLDFLMLDPETRAKVAPDIHESVIAAAKADGVISTKEPVVVTWSADTNAPPFEDFPKIPRLNRECVITEKIDGINAVIYIGSRSEFEATIPPALALFDDLFLYVGTRSQWITPLNDVHGLAKWAMDNAKELFNLGPGRHSGEWWGSGVRRDYGLKRGEKRFSLFNTSRWLDPHVTQPQAIPNDPKVRVAPQCCYVVPTLYRGLFTTDSVNGTINWLRERGSVVAPGYLRPEGVVVFHTAANMMFKVTLQKDHAPKGAQS